MAPFAGTNSKAVEARQRKANATNEKRLADEKRKEDAAWKDDVTEAKLNKKEAMLNKAQEKCNRKAETRRMAAEEEEKLGAVLKGKGNKPVPKLSRAVIEQRALLASVNAAKAQEKKVIPGSIIIEQDLPSENINILRADAEVPGSIHVTASSVEEYLEAIQTEKEIDRNPERRLKAAFAAYEEEWMRRLREESPTLKRSQLKDRVWKQWQKAPENPLNQQPASY